MKLVLAGVVALAAVGAAQAMASGPTLNDCGKRVTKPKTFIVTCADANYKLTKLSWSSWGGSTAAAAGTAVLNTCQPNCASGKFKSYPAKAKASSIKSCGSHKEYSKLTITYTKTHPPGVGKTDFVKLKC